MLDAAALVARPTANGDLPSNSGSQDVVTPSTEREQKTDSGAQAGRPAGKQAVHLPQIKRFVPITTAIPRASLPQMLRLLGSARRLGPSTAEGIVAGMQGGTISVDKARRPLEILRRIRLLDQTEDSYRPTSDVELIDAAMRTSDLDSLSSVLERFDPYRLFLEALRSRRQLKRAEVVPLIHDLVGAAGVAESERLPRFLIILGQAWTIGDTILDGSQRATDRDATDSFETAFREVASVGIARVLDLLPRFCTLTRTSPWAAKRQIENSWRRACFPNTASSRLRAPGQLRGTRRSPGLSTTLQPSQSSLIDSTWGNNPSSQSKGRPDDLNAG